MKFCFPQKSWFKIVNKSKRRFLSLDGTRRFLFSNLYFDFEAIYSQKFMRIASAHNQNSTKSIRGTWLLRRSRSQSDFCDYFATSIESQLHSYMSDWIKQNLNNEEKIKTRGVVGWEWERVGTAFPHLFLVRVPTPFCTSNVTWSLDVSFHFLRVTPGAAYMSKWQIISCIAP